jgi:hypothetical protein
MDTVGSGMSAFVSALSGMPRYNSDGYGGHLYVPWWGWDKHGELGFPRGYHIEVVAATACQASGRSRAS